MTEEKLGTVACERRFWRSRDLTIGKSSLANARPALTPDSEMMSSLPPYELTAIDLIRMARAARDQDR